MNDVRTDQVGLWAHGKETDWNLALPFAEKLFIKRSNDARAVAREDIPADDFPFNEALLEAITQRLGSGRDAETPTRLSHLSFPPPRTGVRYFSFYAVPTEVLV